MYMQMYPEKRRAAGTIVRLAIGCALVSAAVLIVSFRDGPGLRVMAASKPTFNDQIVPILQKNCLACHSSAVHRGGLALDSYDSLMKGGRHGQVIVPHDASQSRLVGMLEGGVEPQMPYGADPLPDAEIAMFKSWIDAGAEGPPNAESTNLPACQFLTSSRRLQWSRRLHPSNSHPRESSWR